MVLDRQLLDKINDQIDLVFERIESFENQYSEVLVRVHPEYKESALNLIHYLALRSFNIETLDKEWEALGLPITTQIEGQVLQNLVGFKVILHSLMKAEDFEYDKPFITIETAEKLLKKHTNALLGEKPKRRETRVMVTQPTTASEDPVFIQNLLNAGMNVARINCAHDDEAIWKAIIDRIKEAEGKCRIAMDLGGPKIRTGLMKPGPKVIHIKPERNALGQVVNPARVWLAPYGIKPSDNSTPSIAIPVNKKWLKKTEPGSYVIFRDARDKKCKLTIEECDGIGRWASCYNSAFVSSDTLLNVFLQRQSDMEIHTVHELLPLEEIIYLFAGDYLKLNKEDIPGEPAQYDENGEITKIAHISCTEPAIFKSIKPGEPIFFDDGKIEGIIESVHDDHALIQITSTKKNGGKLRARKGINFPESQLDIKGLTSKDKRDIKFIAEHADLVNFSFVNSKDDVEDLLSILDEQQSDLGVVLKIETMEAYQNLPSILLSAMANYPVGVMIARGDLAIEAGWKKFAIIQEEILRLCEAAHIPNIWATQVLENLAKKGVPTRSEITDAAMAQRSECVMLNKGYYIVKAVKMLDKILWEMQKIQKKKKKSPKLKFNPVV
ncbi:MAG: hypothetical protein KJO49_05990 [Bacteroidia bacterium]|nr:hypothetical protein [Bacteroidia bacterium]NNK69716.1 hypothetical protein [Flavobacteriaceae bacterium]